MTTFVIKDKNLIPENIKKGVTILKVTGTLEGGRTVTLQSKTVDSSTEKQTVTYDSGYDGLKDVTIEAYELDSKTVNSSTSQQVITSDKDGLSSVTVNPYTLDSKTVDASTVSQTVNSSADGLSSVTVNPYKLQSKTVDSSSSAQIVTPDQNYNGLSQVTVWGMAIIDGVEETFDQNGQYVIHASDYDAQGISDITIDVSVEGSSSDSSIYEYAFGITQSPDMRSAAPRCIITDHVIDNANFVGMSGYIAAPYSQNTYWVFGVDCDVQSKAPVGPKFGIYVNGDDMTFYFGETDGLTVSNEDTDFHNGAYFNVYEDTDDTGDHIVEVNGVSYDYEEETGLGWMSNTVSNELYIFARNANGTAYDIAPEGTFFQNLMLNYNDGESGYTSGFEAAVEGNINESGWFEGSEPVLYYWGDDDEYIIQMPSGYSYNVINMYDAAINNDIIDLSEGGDSELVMFDPAEGRPAGVIIPVAGSGGGDTWFVQAKRGEISDVAAYSFDGLEAIEYGAAYACAGSDIETYPELTFGEASQPQRSLKSDMKSGAKSPEPPVVANHALEGAFRGCSELYNDDAVITINGSVGDYSFNNLLADSHVNDVTIDASTISGERAFEYAFANATVDGDIVVTASEITNSFASAFQVVNRNDYGRRWGTVSFPNLDTITGEYAFENAFYESYFETVSFPSLDTFEEFSLSQMFFNSHVGKLIAHPAMFCYDYEPSPIFDSYDLTEIELSDTAVNDMYFLWQPNLSSASVYNILSNLSDQDPYTVKFWGEYSWDEEQGEDVLTNNLRVYDYPDNRILGALNDAESAGWVIENLTIYPASSVDYITTGKTDTTKLEVPGINNKNTVLEVDAYIKKLIGETNNTYPYINGGTNANNNRWHLGIVSNYKYLYAGNPNTSGNSISVSSIATNGRFNMCLGVRSDNYLWAKTKANSASTWDTVTGNVTCSYTAPTDKLTLTNSNVYSLKYWEGWDDTSTGGNSKVLVHDFVPVSYYNSVDDVTEYGLFDNVEAKFYTNDGITGASER